MTNREQFEQDHADFGTLADAVELNIEGDLHDLRDWTERQWSSAEADHEPGRVPLNFDDA